MMLDWIQHQRISIPTKDKRFVVEQKQSLNVCKVTSLKDV